MPIYGGRRLFRYARVSTDNPMLESENSRMTAYFPVQDWQNSTTFVQLVPIHHDSAAGPRDLMGREGRGPSHGLPRFWIPPPRTRSCAPGAWLLRRTWEVASTAPP